MMLAQALLLALVHAANSWDSFTPPKLSVGGNSSKLNRSLAAQDVSFASECSLPVKRGCPFSMYTSLTAIIDSKVDAAGRAALSRKSAGERGGGGEEDCPALFLFAPSFSSQVSQRPLH
jgi:hypothetical protein